MGCHFDKDGLCYALACYTGFKCGAKDKTGYPQYADFESSVNAYKLLAEKKREGE